MTRNRHIGSSFDSFLEEEGIREDVELLAAKKSIALQLRKAMARTKTSERKLTAEMATSRTAVRRMLDPDDTGVTLATLAKASRALGLQVRVEFSRRRAARSGGGRGRRRSA
jgi:DNA-binding Xre family transcriptional regulator